jgi:hypothetical protein
LLLFFKKEALAFLQCPVGTTGSAGFTAENPDGAGAFAPPLATML